jgi:hypothetical protein
MLIGLNVRPRHCPRGHGLGAALDKGLARQDSKLDKTPSPKGIFENIKIGQI